MLSATEIVARLYDRFNAHDVDGALELMHRDVVWANGLAGGHVHGHKGVRDYWTRQWAEMDSRAAPLGISSAADDTVLVEVHVSARDRAGALLFDAKARHVFRVEDGLIRRFDIG
jgi:ketosteroid isomerase-like protein